MNPLIVVSFLLTALTIVVAGGICYSLGRALTEAHKEYRIISDKYIMLLENHRDLLRQWRDMIRDLPPGVKVPDIRVGDDRDRSMDDDFDIMGA